MPNVREEALRWVRENEGMKCVSQTYNSPRISSEIPDCSMPMTFDSMEYYEQSGTKNSVDRR